ncbi:HinfI family type II restriction enzyme [uncultured Brachyspira sp.]|uniref:HinfI family type II restriction enzyme n=1 Tax=uncultured Brachyspira sp. TaxID=221953 RepID=UPI0025DB6989|nr:restriction endonuclease [uncultured Brachyspira sp.]
MNDNINIKNIINEAVCNIIKKSSSKDKIDKLNSKHNLKMHFIPKRYRIFGGLLQSMNIQFGNFIEELMKIIISNEEKYKIIDEYSGKKSNKFKISKSNETRIDNYITDCQTAFNTYEQLENAFKNLQKEILNDIKNNTENINNSFEHDIDLLFEDKETSIIYYLEIKYNDDHDTGKFVDINRKFIKTFAYLSNEFKTRKIMPILFFFNNKKMKGNIYIPEDSNIRRGKKFFDEFLSINYDNIDNYLQNLSESIEVLKMFDDLYKKIMSIK